MSHPSRQAIAETLRQRNQDVRITLIDTQTDLDALVRRQPDVVFLGMKFITRNSQLGLQDTEKIWVSQFLNKHNVTHTGSAHQAHALDCDKSLAKAQLKRAGLATADYTMIRRGEAIDKRTAPVGFPLFVKPVNRGGGLGIDSESVVYSYSELVRKVHKIKNQLGSDVLVEQYLPGREFSVAILQNPHSRVYSVVPVELIAEADSRGQRILGEEAKCANREQVVELQPGHLRRAVSQLALNSFKELGGRDYGRIDIRLDEHGQPHFLEANLLPSLIGGYGTFPKACKLGLEMSYTEVIETIPELAETRQADSVHEHSSNRTLSARDILSTRQ